MKVLIGLHGCTGWSALLLFACNSQFFQVTVKSPCGLGCCLLGGGSVVVDLLFN